MKIIKPYKNLRIYQVVGDNNEVLAEFDDYNHQRPYEQAKKFVQEKGGVEARGRKE